MTAGGISRFRHQILEGTGIRFWRELLGLHRGAQDNVGLGEKVEFSEESTAIGVDWQERFSSLRWSEAQERELYDLRILHRFRKPLHRHENSHHHESSPFLPPEIDTAASYHWRWSSSFRRRRSTLPQVTIVEDHHHHGDYLCRNSPPFWRSAELQLTAVSRSSLLQPWRSPTCSDLDHHRFPKDFITPSD